MLEQAEVNHTLYLGIANLIDKCTNSLWGITTTTKTTYSRHTRIVPTANESLLDELEHLTLRHHGICDVEAIELILAWAIVACNKLIDIVVV